MINLKQFLWQNSILFTPINILSCHKYKLLVFKKDDWKDVGEVYDMFEACLTSLIFNNLIIICMSKMLKIAYLMEKSQKISIRTKNLGLS